MNDISTLSAGTEVDVRDEGPGAAEFRDDVLRGLSAPRRTIPAKYFYDARGAELFDAITRLEVYYLTRVELGILWAHLSEIAARLGPRCMLLEFGSGSARKTELLLSRLEDPVAYVPIDLARAQLAGVAATLSRRFPDLEVLPVCADYTREVVLPGPRREPARTIVFFPGSTIGNLEPDESVEFLTRTRQLCGPGGGTLIGVDRQKDRLTLERAYNDPEGVTAAFNVNLLHRMRRELGAELDATGFVHRAIYNEGAGRIEMHLVATRPQSVRVPLPAGGVASFTFATGDVIVTEHSYKYTIAGFSRLARAAGLGVASTWSDPADLFSVFYLEPLQA